MGFRLPWVREKKSDLSKRFRTPWILKVPGFFQISSSLSFLSLVTLGMGVAAFRGLSDPTNITDQMPAFIYPGYGLLLTAASLALMYGIVARDLLLEKFSARIISMCLGTFGCWALAANGLSRSIIILGLASIAIFLLEQRISLINCLLQAKRIAYHFPKKEIESNGGESQ